MNPVPYLPMIRRIARLYHTQFLEQEDLVQEACLALLERKASCPGDSSSSGYSRDGAKTENEATSRLAQPEEHETELLIHAAIHHAIRRYEHPEDCSLQAAKGEAEQALLPGEEAVSPDSPCLADLETLMRRAHIPRRARHILRLHYGLNGRPPLSREEIAQKTGISENTVKCIIHNTLLRLKSQSQHTRFA